MEEEVPPSESTGLLSAKTDGDYSDAPRVSGDFLESLEAQDGGEEVDIAKAMEDHEMSRHMVTAWIIDNTMRFAPVEDFHSIPRTKANRRSYLFFENTAWVRQFAVFCLIMLSFIEMPSYCSKARECISADGTSLFLSGLPMLTGFQAQVANISLLIVLWFFMFFDAFSFQKGDLHKHAFLLRGLHLLLLCDAVYFRSSTGLP